MKDHVLTRQRVLIAWVATALFSVAAVLLALLVSPVRPRVLGVPLDTALDVLASLSVVAVLAVSVAWYRSMPKVVEPITVREIRQRASKISRRR